MPNPILYHHNDSIRIEKYTYQDKQCSMPTHTHEYLTISLVLSGRVIEQNEGREVFAKAGGLSIKPIDMPHSNTFSEKCTILSMKIYDPSYYTLSFEDWKWFENSHFLPFFLKIIRSKHPKQELIYLKKYLLRQNSYIYQKKVVPTWLAEVQGIIKGHFHELITIQNLAKEVRKHPVHVARYFQQYYGIDIKTYQNHLRIQEAMHQAILGKKNLTQIAYDNGFADQSHFSRVFKQNTELSPRQALQLLHV